MADVQITCVNKIPRQDPHHGITHVGGNGWKITRQEAVNAIQQNVHTFYTMVGGKRANVAVVTGQHDPYLRTHADGYYNDNLLALREC